MKENNKLTKAEIIENIKENTGLTATDIHRVIDEFFGEVSEALKEGRTAELRGFGTFDIKIRKGREKARNPKTGEACSVEPHGVVFFRAGKELKDAVWKITE